MSGSESVSGYADPFRPVDLIATIKRWDREGIKVFGPLGKKVVKCDLGCGKPFRWRTPSVEDVFMQVEEHRQGRQHQDMLFELRALRLLR